MAEQQATISQSPPPVAPAAPEAAMTPEAAAERIEELKADKGWGTKFLAGDLGVQRESDLLYKIAHGTEETRNRAIAEMGARQSITTPEQAKGRIEELTTDAAWRTKYLAGDRAAKKELDRLEAIAAGVDPNSALATGAKVLTPAEARAAALDAVPTEPTGYKIDWPRDDSGPMPPAGISAVQGWMHGAGLTQSEAQTAISFAARDVATWQAMNDDARERHVNDTLARFNKMRGDQAPKMLEGARRLVAEITAKDGGQLKEFLEESGAGASLAVIVALADAAKRRYSAPMQPSGVTPKRPVGR